MTLNLDHQRALEHLRQDMLNKYYTNLEDRQPSSPSTSRRRFEDLSKTNKQLTEEAEKWRRKFGDVQEKYERIRNLLSKDKNSSRIREEENFVEKRNFVRSFSMVEEIN